MYVRIRATRDQPGGETLAQFGRRLGWAADSTGAKRLFVDLRGNEGGRTQSYPELVRNVIAFSARPGHRVYVLIDRHTFSAALKWCSTSNGSPTPFSWGNGRSGSLSSSPIPSW